MNVHRHPVMLRSANSAIIFILLAGLYENETMVFWNLLIMMIIGTRVSSSTNFIFYKFDQFVSVRDITLYSCHYS